MFPCVFVVFSIVTSIAVAELVQNGVFSCGSHEFECQNGSCISLEYLCDGIQHCSDASDENSCEYSRNRSRRSNNCILPEYPNHGSYEVLNNLEARPGQSFNSLQLTVRCNRGYGVLDGNNGSNISVFCINGEWNQNMPQCVRYCRLDSDPSVRYMCHVPGVGLKVCGNYVAPGTSVSPVCNTPIYYSSRSLPTMKCVTGFWNYVAQCEAECGRVTPEAFQLVIDGKEAKRGELPWHAGIYRKKSNPPEQICSGSLVSNNVVISAAHCFWNDLIKLLPASDYSVAVGKLHRSWDSESDVGVQKSDVKQIKIPSLFEGEAANYQEDIAVLILTNPFVYKTYIRPVCLNFDIDFERWQLQQGNPGKVAGWGLTAANGNASSVLKVVNMPYISEIVCIRTLPPSFREYITGDKFCAGYTNGTALCKGDSGGGLAFAEKELGIDRYYLRGVVSAAPQNNDKLCNDNTYTTFTKVTKHQDLINDALAESLRTCGFYAFQCDDGTCVDQGADCNGKQECADGSDESDKLCRGAEDTRNLSDMSDVCILPPYPDHGTYVVTSDPSARPGQLLDTFVLKMVCSEGYHIRSDNSTSRKYANVYCSNGVWYEDMPKCVPITCTWRGIEGKCVPSRACLSALDKTLGAPTPPACGTSNDEPLICCTDCELINDSRLLLSDPVLGILARTGTSKAKDKCLEYLHALDYPCKKDSSLRNVTVQLDPVQNCYRTVNHQLNRHHSPGRRNALREEFPHMALLGFKDSVDPSSWKCGGTVISEIFILTAANCLNERTLGPVKYVALGILKRSDPVELWQRYNVKRAIPHPEYKPPASYHDIALLETNKKIVFNSAVLPACLHMDDDLDTHAYITGWGVPSSYSEPSDELHSILQMRYTKEKCESQNAPGKLLDNGYDNQIQICYGETAGSGSPCQGDIGGPLQSQDHEQCVFTILGVLSYGRSCYIKGDANIYTRVKYYLPWIEDIVWP